MGRFQAWRAARQIRRILTRHGFDAARESHLGRGWTVQARSGDGDLEDRGDVAVLIAAPSHTEVLALGEAYRAVLEPHFVIRALRRQDRLEICGRRTDES